MTRLVFGQLFAPPPMKNFFDLEKDTKLVDTVLSEVLSEYPSVKTNYLLGERFSICDIMLACEIMQNNMMNYDLENKFPELWGYLERCFKDRPELRKVHFAVEKISKKRFDSWLDKFNLDA